MVQTVLVGGASKGLGFGCVQAFAQKTIALHLLDPESPENMELEKQMGKNYPVDGKNAERAADVLKAVIERGE